MFPRGLAEGSGVETNTPLFLPALKARNPPPPPPESLLPDCIEAFVKV